MISAACAEMSPAQALNILQRQKEVLGITNPTLQHAVAIGIEAIELSLNSQNSFCACECDFQDDVMLALHILREQREILGITNPTLQSAVGISICAIERFVRCQKESNNV